MAASCRLGRNHGETRSYLATSIGLSPLLAPHPSYPIKTCPSSNYQPQAPPKFSLCLKLRHELFTLQCATTQLIAFQSAPVLMKTTYLKQAVQWVMVRCRARCQCRLKCKCLCNFQVQVQVPMQQEEVSSLEQEEKQVQVVPMKEEVSVLERRLSCKKIIVIF